MDTEDAQRSDENPEMDARAEGTCEAGAGSDEEPDPPAVEDRVPEEAGYGYGV